jgi:subtilisin family serine protease
MDQRKKLQVFFVIVCAFSLLACGKEDPVEKALPTQDSACGGEALPNQYLIQWSDGSTTLEKNISREELKENIVRNNLHKIKTIEFNQKFELAQFSKSASSFSGAIDNWSYERIKVAKLWQQNLRGQGAIVAVVDTGLDINHLKLKNNVYTNPGESGLDAAGKDKATNNFDDDGNGYIDDVNGYNFVEGSNQMIDDVGHGTHVSGIIAMEHHETIVTNSVPLGMAPAAKILPVRFLGKDGGTLNDALLALDYVKNSKANIVNASWGGTGCSKILEEKIAALAEKNILFVVASGNSGSNLERYPEYPAAFILPHQITVGSVSPLDGMSSFSNYSKKLVHIFAPGYEIYSSIPGGGFSSQSGTSMATPFIAGAAALLVGQNSNKTVNEIKDGVLSFISPDSDYQNTTRGRLSF